MGDPVIGNSATDEDDVISTSWKQIEGIIVSDLERKLLGQNWS